MYEPKAFFKKSLLVSGVFLLAALVVTQLVYTVAGDPGVAAVESPLLVEKERLLLASGDRYNLVFLGSSLTFRQIDPEVFDAELGGLTRSYNMGNPGLYPLRSLSYLDHLLDVAPDSLKYIVFELYKLDSVTYNYSAPNIMRLMTPTGYAEAVSAIQHSQLGRQEKLNLFYQYSRAFLFRSFGFGLWAYLNVEKPLREQDEEWLASAPSGYYPKDIELSETPLQGTRKKLEDLNSQFLRQTNPPAGSVSLLDARIQLHQSKYTKQWPQASGPMPVLMQRLIDKAEKRGIQLIIWQPPLVSDVAVNFSFPVFLGLPEENRIDLSSPERFPGLYQADRLFDITHVNSEGGLHFSKALAREFKALN